jgi:glutaconate CoA-transferase subunit A
MSVHRSDRLIEIQEAVSLVKNGMTVGLSGFSYQNPPMAIVRELIRQGVEDLTLVSGPTAGIETDMLIGAGCVSRLVSACVSFENIDPIAPAFRHRAESGELKVWECDECIWYVALKAAAWGVPYLLWRGGVGSSLPELNPDLLEIEEDGEWFLRVAAIQPDIVFLHAPAADRYGNVQFSSRSYLGRRFAERALAEACAGPVVASVERVIPNHEVVAHPEWTLLRGALVAEAPWGSHPGGLSGMYVPDLDRIRLYDSAATALRSGSDDALQQYLRDTVFDLADHDAYLDTLDAAKLDDLSMRPAS